MTRRVNPRYANTCACRNLRCAGCSHEEECNEGIPWMDEENPVFGKQRRQVRSKNPALAHNLRQRAFSTAVSNGNRESTRAMYATGDAP
jgi:hypothetical protein